MAGSGGKADCPLRTDLSAIEETQPHISGGCFGGLLRINTSGMNVGATKGSAMRYVFTLVPALAVVAFVEWSTDEDMMTMLIICVASCALGVLFPRMLLLSGLLIGLVVPAIAVVSQATAWHPGYETAAQAARHHLGYAVSLTVLIVPAIIAAALGSFLRTRTRQSLPAERELRR